MKSIPSSMRLEQTSQSISLDYLDTRIAQVKQNIKGLSIKVNVLQALSLDQSVTKTTLLLPSQHLYIRYRAAMNSDLLPSGIG